MNPAETIEPTPNAEAPNAEAITPAGEEPVVRSEEEDEHHAHHHPAPTLNPECTREVEIEIPADEVSKNFKQVSKRYQKMAHIPGFRSGKVPESLVRKRYAEQIRQDVMESVLPAHFRAALQDKNLRPVSQPQVTDLDLQEGKPLRFKAAFEVVPEFSIDGYQQVTVPKQDVSVTDAEFQEELDRIRDSRSTMEPVPEERELENGDFAEVSFTGQVQTDVQSDAPSDVQSDAQSGTQSDPNEEHAASPEAAAPEADRPPNPADDPIVGHDVLVEIGGKNTLESFSAALTGAKPGQELKFEVSYPPEFQERRLAGKTVAYDVQVKSIKKRIQPELNDEFAKELGPYESYADFVEKLREAMANDKRRRMENETKSRLVESLVAKYDFPVPESLVQQQIDTRLDRGLRALAAQGMRTEEMRNLDFDRLRAAQRGPATAEVKASILLDRVADAEQVEVSEEEVERELKAISRNGQEPVEALRKRLTENGGLARIREQLRREKMGDLLYERLPA